MDWNEPARRYRAAENLYIGKICQVIIYQFQYRWEEKKFFYAELDSRTFEHFIGSTAQELKSEKKRPN